MKQTPNNKFQRNMLVYLVSAFLIVMGLRFIVFPSLAGTATEDVTYTEFLEMVDDEPGDGG